MKLLRRNQVCKTYKLFNVLLVSRLDIELFTMFLFFGSCQKFCSEHTYFVFSAICSCPYFKILCVWRTAEHVPHGACERNERATDLAECVGEHECLNECVSEWLQLLLDSFLLIQQCVFSQCQCECCCSVFGVVWQPKVCSPVLRSSCCGRWCKRLSCLSTRSSWPPSTLQWSLLIRSLSLESRLPFFWHLVDFCHGWQSRGEQQPGQALILLPDFCNSNGKVYKAVLMLVEGICSSLLSSMCIGVSGRAKMPNCIVKIQNKFSLGHWPSL